MTLLYQVRSFFLAFISFDSIQSSILFIFFPMVFFIFGQIVLSILNSIRKAGK